MITRNGSLYLQREGTEISEIPQIFIGNMPKLAPKISFSPPHYLPQSSLFEWETNNWPKSFIHPHHPSQPHPNIHIQLYEHKKWNATESRTRQTSYDQALRTKTQRIKSVNAIETIKLRVLLFNLSKWATIFQVVTGFSSKYNIYANICSQQFDYYTNTGKLMETEAIQKPPSQLQMLN